MAVFLLLSYAILLPVIALVTQGLIKDILLYLHAIGFVCLAYIGATKTTDTYGLRHILFNLEIPPQTLWFNMGLWDESTTKFPEACEKLVHAVMDKIPIKENNHILDVGYGCGDSSFLFADFYQCKVTGITNEAAQWEISQKRLETQYNHLQNRITFVHGSADTLDTIVGQQCFDHVISIDSAYHYCTRWDFLRRAYQHLKPDGSIGLFDLTLHPQLAQRMTPTKKWFLAVLCRAIGIPVANLVVADEYRDRLFALGYKDVNIESIDRKRVFGGLVHALKTQHERCHIFNVVDTCAGQCETQRGLRPVLPGFARPASKPLK